MVVAKNTSSKRTVSRSTPAEQPTLALDGYEPPLQLRLSEHTRRTGLKHIALIREQMAARTVAHVENPV